MPYPNDHFAFIGIHSPCLALSAVTSADGQPVQRFRKELIRTGHFVKQADGVEFDVTGETLVHWAATLSAMKANGVKIPVPNKHCDPVPPENNMGWLVDWFVEDDRLVGVLDLVGEGIKLASRSDVSLFVPPEWTDGQGNRYTRPIKHVALCTDPVIPGLGEFQSIAASLSAPNKEKAPMDLEKLKKALGIKDEITADNAETLILSAAETIVIAKTDLQKKVDDLTKKVDELTKSETALKLSTKQAAPDPMIVKLAAENMNMKLGALVPAARITPAVRDKLATLFIGDGTTAALELEMTRGPGTELFDGVIAALAENDPVKLKEQTGPQSLELSDPAGDGTNPLVKDAEARAKAAAANN